MTHLSSTLYYYDRNGYQTAGETGAFGATPIAPGPITTPGKVAKWTGDAWAEADPVSATNDPAEQDFDYDSLAQAFEYDEDGNLSTITAGPDSNGISYVQTFTWTDGRLTTISPWVQAEIEVI